MEALTTVVDEVFFYWDYLLIPKLSTRQYTHIQKMGKMVKDIQRIIQESEQGNNFLPRLNQCEFDLKESGKKQK